MIARTMALAVAMLGGVTTSQLPEFAQQYRQRLGGAIDALTEVVEEFRADAATHGLTPGEAIDRLEGSSDRLVAAQGERAQRALDRLAGLQRQQEAFREAGPFGRLVVLARDLDPQIASRAFEDFEPAVPATMEGAVTAAGGFLTVLLGAGLFGRATRRLRRRRDA